MDFPRTEAAYTEFRKTWNGVGDPMRAFLAAHDVKTDSGNFVAGHLLRDAWAEIEAKLAAKAP